MSQLPQVPVLGLACSEFIIMKKSKDWVRKPELEHRLDQLVDEQGYSIEELNAYEAAKALKLSDGGEFYKTFRNWKERRIAKSENGMFEVPPEDQAAFREIATNFAEAATEQFIHSARKLGCEIDRAAGLRIADAERRVADARREVEVINDRWCEAEAARDEAISRAKELEVQLHEAAQRQYQLLGRIEQLMRDRREQPAAPPASPATPVSPEADDGVHLEIPSNVAAHDLFPEDHEHVSEDDNELDRGLDDPASPIDHAPRDTAEIKPLAIEASPPGEGQSEMPQVIIDPAQEASIDND